MQIILVNPWINNKFVLLYRRTNAPKITRNINEVFGEGAENERIIRWWFEKFWFGKFTRGNQSRDRPETNVVNNELKTVREAGTS